MGVQKPRKDPNTGLSPATRYPLLEEQLVQLFITAMDEAEGALERNPEGLDPNLSLLWWNLSSELIFFLLYQFVTFPTFVDSIHRALNLRTKKPVKEGRDFLMWALLQYISGSIAKNSSTDFMTVLKLYSLYNESQPLPGSFFYTDKLQVILFCFATTNQMNCTFRFETLYTRQTLPLRYNNNDINSSWFL